MADRPENELREITLRNNRLTELPENIGNSRGLERLDVSGNRLRTLPDSLRELPNLRALNVANNPRLVALPTGLRLDTLDISGCEQLAELPDDLQVRLWVELAGTRLRKLPDGVRGARLLWRGVAIDARIALRPEKIRAADVLHERNIERRRVMLERMGYDLFLHEAAAEVIHRDRDRGGDRALLRVTLPGDEPLVCLCVRDPSTGRQYLLRVPPHLGTCHQAAAWIAGFDNPDDYHPLVET